ncbi:hypothetical protein GCM10028793_35700 [Nocardiopsis oceani]
MVEVRAIPGFARKTDSVGLTAGTCHCAGASTDRVSRLVNARVENPDDLAPVSTLGRREWRQGQDHSHSGPHLSDLPKNTGRGAGAPFLEGFFPGEEKAG